MAFGSVNTPGAWLKTQLKEMLARIGSVEVTLTGLEKLTGNGDPTPETPGKVGQIYINILTGQEWVCVEDSPVRKWEPRNNTALKITPADIGAVPTTRKVNNKALSADITLTAADVGARPSTWNPYHAGTSAPSDTTQLWIDTTPSNPGLKYWNGSAWVNVPVYGF